MNDHIALLVKATEGMSAKRKLLFLQAFTGAMCFFVSRRLWVSAIESATEAVRIAEKGSK